MDGKKQESQESNEDEVLLTISHLTKTIQKNSKTIILAGCSIFIFIAVLGLLIDSRARSKAGRDTSEPPAVTDQAEPDAQTEPLTISQTAVSIEAGKTTYLSVSNNKGTVVWMSSNPEVAAVTGGTVTGIIPGSATITAISEEEKVTCMVTIMDPEIDPSIILKLNHSDITLSSKDPPAQLKVKITGSKEKYEGKVVWSSSDLNVATVSDTGLVERVGRGSATITAEANGQTLECLVRIP